MDPTEEKQPRGKIQQLIEKLIYCIEILKKSPEKLPEVSTNVICDTCGCHTEDIYTSSAGSFCTNCRPKMYTNIDID